jgi:hypothetical protein
MIVNDISNLETNNGVTKVILEYGQRLRDFVRRRVGSQEDAEDILQDVYIDLMQTMRVKPIEQMSAWLYRVARNKIIDRYRKHKPVLYNDMNVAKSDGDDGHYFIEEILGAKNDPGFLSKDNKLIRDTLFKALEELPTEQREVFIRHEFEQQGFQEMADELKVTLNTLLSRKHYAIKYLRKRLNPLYQELFKQN